MPQHDEWDAEERDALAPFGDELRESRERHRGDPPLELLRAGQAGALPAGLQERAKQYLEQDAWSRALVEGADTAEGALDGNAEEDLFARIQSEVLRSGRRHVLFFRHWRPFMAAAAAVALLAALVFWRMVVPSARIGAPAAGPVAAEPAPHGSAAPPSPAFVLALEKPQIKLTASVLLFRGSPGDDRFLNDLAPAVQAYREGDYARAGQEFAALASRYPGSTEVHFYLGVTRLFLDDISGATAALESARKLNDVSFAPDVSWYLAIAYERARRPGDARSELESLCRGKSAYAEGACAAREKFRPETRR